MLCSVLCVCVCVHVCACVLVSVCAGVVLCITTSYSLYSSKMCPNNSPPPLPPFPSYPLTSLPPQYTTTSSVSIFSKRNGKAEVFLPDSLLAFSPFGVPLGQLWIRSPLPNLASVGVFVFSLLEVTFL